MTSPFDETHDGYEEESSPWEVAGIAAVFAGLLGILAVLGYFDIARGIALSVGAKLALFLLVLLVVSVTEEEDDDWALGPGPIIRAGDPEDVDLQETVSVWVQRWDDEVRWLFDQGEQIIAVRDDDVATSDLSRRVEALGGFDHMGVLEARESSGDRIVTCWGAPPDEEHRDNLTRSHSHDVVAGVGLTSASKNRENRRRESVVISL